MLRIKSDFENKQLFINENGTIKEVTFVSMQILKKDDTHIVIWKYKHNGVEGEITTEYGKCPFCPNADMAVQNYTMSCEEYNMYVRGISVLVLYDNEVKKFYLNVYTFRNGVVKYETLELSSILYEQKYCGVSVELVEDVKYYRTKEECIAYNKITEIDYNGNEGVFKHSGYMQDMVAYTDEQKKVIETLQKAFKDAKECGLQCLVGDNHLRLINVKSFPKYRIIDTEWECEDDALDVYFTEDVAMVEGVYRNYGDSPALVVE
jgi:hypothetical protein